MGVDLIPSVARMSEAGQERRGQLEKGGQIYFAALKALCFGWFGKKLAAVKFSETRRKTGPAS
ncbi:hypothetical protein CRX69_14515 [Pseudomonas rhizophila]|uniref:Uncharacterized protein n=1 Tax=Pseudomonas rhizophila TaxID=2045200 RepID=A0ABN5JT64_9PSED|nr:hypothetical protein CRX69_14515 [Pseudomonas rhizophila]